MQRLVVKGLGEALAAARKLSVYFRLNTYDHHLKQNTRLNGSSALCYRRRPPPPRGRTSAGRRSGR